MGLTPSRLLYGCCLVTRRCTAVEVLAFNVSGSISLWRPPEAARVVSREEKARLAEPATEFSLALTTARTASAIGDIGGMAHKSSIRRAFAK